MTLAMIIICSIIGGIILIIGIFVLFTMLTTPSVEKQRAYLERKKRDYEEQPQQKQSNAKKYIINAKNSKSKLTNPNKRKDC